MLGISLCRQDYEKPVTSDVIADQEQSRKNDGSKTTELQADGCETIIYTALKLSTLHRLM
jgi:hypothetical protein